MAPLVGAGRLSEHEAARRDKGYEQDTTELGELYGGPECYS